MSRPAPSSFRALAVVVAVSCALVACGDAGTASPNDGFNGELEGEPGDPPQTAVKVYAPAAVDIASVEYTVNCSSPSAPVRLNGNLEVSEDDGAKSDAAVWQGFMDLPVGPCTVQARARDDDGEVICTGTEAVEVDSEQAAEVELVLTCSA